MPAIARRENPIFVEVASVVNKANLVGWAVPTKSGVEIVMAGNAPPTTSAELAIT